ncbi:sugar phosphate isomerase/epimerase family protein [Streptomyces tsukubensis]|uniref:sugar phosphate isomerase/epimerase family protein n=1 Tax=Streptomyces tsukubensis TaxID=83656 RepID=UPI00098F344B|nr:sugar phosphate isomerase/epimerase [Streptomyces tsukubensis]QFR97023.1 TIM barrel protein [Streptomyces tsukubensis]
MLRELTLSAQTLRAVPFGTRVTAAVEAGFTGLGLSVEQYRDAIEAGWTDRRMLGLLTKHGLRVTEVELLTGWAEDPGHGTGDDAEVHRVARTFRPQRVHATVFQEHPLAALTEGFAEVCRTAAGYGARAALEFMPYAGVTSVQEAWRVVGGAGEPNGGLLVDAWHWTRSGAAATDLDGIPADRVAAVQLADTLRKPLRDPGYEARHHRLLPGEGSGDVTGMLRTLWAHGVRAPLAVEVVSDLLDAQNPQLTARQAYRSSLSAMESAHLVP